MTNSHRNRALLPVRARTAIGPAVLALCVITACSSGGGSHASTPPTSTTVASADTSTSADGASSGSSTTASTAGGAAATGAVLHACTLLSKSQASAAAGEKFDSAKEMPFATYGTVCTYDNPSGPSMDVTVMNQIPGLDINTVKAEMAGAASKDAPLVSVSGLGDQAWTDALGTSASFGTHIVQIDGLENDLFGKHHDSEAVARAVIAAAG